VERSRWTGHTLGFGAPELNQKNDRGNYIPLTTTGKIVCCVLCLQIGLTSILADVYSCGVTVWSFVEGSDPPKTGKPSFSPERWQDLSDVEALIARCIQPAAKDRPSFDDLAKTVSI